MGKPSSVGAYLFGVIIGIPAFLVIADIFCWALPALSNLLDAL